MQNKIITDWVFTGGRYTDDPPEGFETFDSCLPMTVNSVNAKGKFIYFILTDKNGDEHYILHSLMMTGRWQYDYDEQCKWFIDLQEKDEKRFKISEVWFRDPRAFATLKFTNSREVLNEKLAKLGPDVMSKEFTLPKFKELCRRWPTRNICSFLMDQSVIAGVGNYIKAEVLYDAAISPLRKVYDLKEREIEKLFEAICVIPRVAYNNKGLSLRDYADEHGRKGGQERNLKIYGKKGKHVKRTKTPDGRMTYWDPVVQH